MFKEVMLELTYRCNLKCGFCYLKHHGLLNKKGRELSTAEVFRVVERFGPGTRYYLSGGEPLMRPDIFEIMGHIKESGSRFGLNTNGTLLNASRAERLAALKPDYVIFSLHGSKATHDRLTGNNGAWRSLTANMKRFAALAAPQTEIIVNCVVNRENAGELLEVYRQGCRAGVRRVVFEHMQFLKPREAAGTPSFLRAGGIITPELVNYSADAALIWRQFAAIRRVGGTAHFETRPLMTAGELDLYYNGEIKPAGACERALNTLNVEPDGRVRLCVLYGLKAGDALTTDIKQLLAFKKKNISAKLPAGCARCCHRFDIFRHF